jgi:hypothetical protein
MYGRLSRWTAVAAAIVGLSTVAEAQRQVKKDDMGSASAKPMGEMAMDGAEYTIVFKSTWLQSSHPFEYPPSGLTSFPHFSGIIGAAHNAQYEIFTPGHTPSPGLERLSEEGKHSPLDEEIKAAVKAGTATSLFTTGPLKDFSEVLTGTFRVDAQHPMVSFVAMIAPSPDWFAGASNVNLWENGQWVKSKTIQVYAWDAGGDEGATYKAADMDNMSKNPTVQAMSRHFAPNGRAVPVATVTITKK